MTTTGKLRVTAREVRPLPKRGRVRTYLCTSAQNNTALHPELWANILALAEHEGAEILVSRITYAANSRASKGQKVNVNQKTAKEGAADDAEYWAPELDDHLCRCGAHVRILDAVGTASAAMKGGAR